jgi:DNA-binding XRE family transcriptional regulator
MPALTRKRLTDGLSELRLIGPAEQREKAIELLKPLGFVESGIPWRECFPEVTVESMPGVALVGARTREGLTQRELAELSGIPQRHISEMENGKRPIGKERARKLAEVLNVNYKVFL